MVIHGDERAGAAEPAGGVAPASARHCGRRVGASTALPRQATSRTARAGQAPGDRDQSATAESRDSRVPRCSRRSRRPFHPFPES